MNQGSESPLFSRKQAKNGRNVSTTSSGFNSFVVSTLLRWPMIPDQLRIPDQRDHPFRSIVTACSGRS